MSQYDMTITYIPEEDNSIADALSRVPEGAFPGESADKVTPHFSSQVANDTPGIHATISITADPSVLDTIRNGYSDDEFCKKVILSTPSTAGISTSNGLWYIGDRLLIPRAGTIREDLFRLTHDTAGHFGADKSYATLRDTYYWPNM
jgi:hypothetical protein